MMIQSEKTSLRASSPATGHQLTTSSAFSSNMMASHSTEQFCCSLCPAEFPRLEDYLTHIVSHRSPDILVDPLASLMYKTELAGKIEAQIEAANSATKTWRIGPNGLYTVSSAPMKIPILHNCHRCSFLGLFPQLITHMAKYHSPPQTVPSTPELLSQPASATPEPALSNLVPLIPPSKTGPILVDNDQPLSSTCNDEGSSTRKSQLSGSTGLLIKVPSIPAGRQATIEERIQNIIMRNSYYNLTRKTSMLMGAALKTQLSPKQMGDLARNSNFQWVVNLLFQIFVKQEEEKQKKEGQSDSPIVVE